MKQQSPFAKQSNFWLDFFSAMKESWKKPKTSNAVSSFVCNRNTLALLRDLLSYNSLFVGQLYEDKTLVISSSLQLTSKL